jgi:hypothetical protein
LLRIKKRGENPIRLFLKTQFVFNITNKHYFSTYNFNFFN